jgi:hypothetical protein
MDYTIKRGDSEIQITAEEFQELLKQAEIQDRMSDVERYLDDNYPDYTPKFKQELYNFYREHEGEEKYRENGYISCLSDGVSQIKDELQGKLDFFGGFNFLSDLANEPEFEAEEINYNSACKRLHDLYSHTDNLIFRERVYEYILIKSCTSCGMELSKAEEEMNINYQATVENLAATTEIAIANYRTPMEKKYDLDKKAYSYTVLSFISSDHIEKEILLPGYVNDDNILENEETVSRLHKALTTGTLHICDIDEISKEPQSDVRFDHYCIGNKNYPHDMAHEAPTELLDDIINSSDINGIRFVDSVESAFDLRTFEFNVYLSHNSFSFSKYTTENGFTVFTRYNDEITESHDWKDIRAQSVVPENGFEDMLKVKQEKFILKGNKEDLPLIEPSDRVIKLFEFFEDDEEIMSGRIEYEKKSDEYFVPLWKDSNDIFFYYFKGGEDDHKFYNDISPNSVKGLFLLPDSSVIRNDVETAFSAVESVEISGYGNMSVGDMVRLYTENDDLYSGDIENVTVNMINRNGVPHKVTTNAEGFYLAVTNFKENYRDFYNAYQRHEANYPKEQNQSQEKGR